MAKVGNEHTGRQMRSCLRDCSGSCARLYGSCWLGVNPADVFDPDDIYQPASTISSSDGAPADGSLAERKLTGDEEETEVNNYGQLGLDLMTFVSFLTGEKQLQEYQACTCTEVNERAGAESKYRKKFRSGWQGVKNIFKSKNKSRITRYYISEVSDDHSDEGSFAENNRAVQGKKVDADDDGSSTDDGDYEDDGLRFAENRPERVKNLLKPRDKSHITRCYIREANMEDYYEDVDDDADDDSSSDDGGTFSEGNGRECIEHASVFRSRDESRITSSNISTANMEDHTDGDDESSIAEDTRAESPSALQIISNEDLNDSPSLCSARSVASFEDDNMFLPPNTGSPDSLSLTYHFPSGISTSLPPDDDISEIVMSLPPGYRLYIFEHIDKGTAWGNIQNRTKETMTEG